MVTQYGTTEPRIWTKPARELTAETSRGFDVIDFAKCVLRVSLFPWQQWLLIHMLELNPDGTLRFRKALVIVGRQNGKTLVAAVLAAYWLYVDAGRWPDQVREHDFVIVGSAQKLDIAMKPWRQVRRWGAPDDVKVGIAPDRVPSLQRFTYPPRTTNGETELRTQGGGTYLPRTFDGARGHSAARLLLDELREQYDYEGWSAIEKSANAMFDSLLVAFSNAGTARSRVLKDVRDISHDGVDDPDTEWFIGEWSAHPDAALDDQDAFAQANPSAGHLPGMTIDGLMRTAANAREKNVERIEVLGQWVTSVAQPFLDARSWFDCADGVELDETGRIIQPGSAIAENERTVLAVDVSGNRSYAFIAAAGHRHDGLVHVELIAQRAGDRWVENHLVQIRSVTGINEVAVQGRGCPAADLIPPLKALGFIVHEIQATALLNATGRLKQRVDEGRLRHRGQPALNTVAENGTVKYIQNMPVWDLFNSPVDAGPMNAATNALYALEQFPPPEKKPSQSPPPQAEVIARDDAVKDEPNLVIARF